MSSSNLLPKCGIVVRRVEGKPTKLMTGDFRQAIRSALDAHDHGELPVEVLRKLGREWGQGCLDMRQLRVFVGKVRVPKI